MTGAMTKDQTVVALAHFFLDEYDDNPNGVSYWFDQNHKGQSVVEFVQTLNSIISGKDIQGVQGLT